MYRRGARGLEVLLGHPGGPFWEKRDDGAWTIPKGLVDEGEDALAAAKREFLEETGFEAGGTAVPLTPLRQPSRKWIHAWAVEGDCDVARACSNLFTMEWPPRSGRQQEFPEIDRLGWFTPDEARRKILAGQAAFISELEEKLDSGSDPNLAG